MQFIFGFKTRKQLNDYISNPFREAIFKGEAKGAYDPKNFVDPDCLELTQADDEYQQQKLTMIKSFWNSPIDFSSPALVKNLSPTILHEETPLSKIHFIFTMLNLNVLYIANEGKIKGIITKLDVINKRKVAQIQKAKLPYYKLQTQDELREFEKVLLLYDKYPKFFENDEKTAE